MSSEEASAERAALLEKVKQKPWALSNASEHHRNDREIVLAAVQQDGEALMFASDDLRNDREVVLAAVEQNYEALGYASDDLQNDREIVLVAVQEYGAILEYTPDNLKNDREIVLAAVRQYGRALEYTSDDLKNDREIVLAALRQNGTAFEYVSDDLKNDRDIVLAAVQQSGIALEYASADLKNDRGIVLAAVRRNGGALMFASDDLKNDREIVLAAVQQNGEALYFASDDLKNDREIVLAAVRQCGKALQHASDELTNDREIVLAAVQEDGNALQYTSDDLKNDHEIVLAAVRQNGGELEYTSDDLKNDRDIVLAAVQQNGEVLEFASDDLKNDREIVLAAVRQNGMALGYASDDLQNDREIVLAAVQQNGRALDYASGDLKNNREIVLAAVQQNGEVLKFASDDLKNDREIVLAAVEQNGWLLEFASDDLKNDREIVLAAVQQNGRALGLASIDLKNDREIVLAAVQQYGTLLKYASDDLKNDREIVLAAVQQDGRALEYTSDDLKNDREIVLAAVRQSDDVKDNLAEPWDVMEQNSGALEYASDDLKNDWEVVRAAVQNEDFRFEEASDSLTNNRKVVRAVIEKDGIRGSVLCHVSTKFTFDDDLTELAVKFLCSEEDCTTLFELIMDNERAAQIGQFVRADPQLCHCLNWKGATAIGTAAKGCREAMEKELRLFGDFDVDAGHLHFSRTACVLSATSHAEGAGGTARVALKGMRELEQVLAELKGRNGLDPNYVVAVRAVYADSSITDANKRKIKEAIPVYESASRTEPAADVRYVEAEVERSLRPLLANRIASASSSGGEASGLTSDTETRSSPGSGYRFMLVFELGGRALSTALMHDRIAGGDLHTARKIGNDVAKSVGHLHKKGRTHLDIKPLNILRIGSTWQLTDLDVSCTTGRPFGKKLPSAGYCPPEMAILLLPAIDEDAIISTGKISLYKADPAYDLWSFGVLLFYLVTGRPLWNCDENDDIELGDLRILAQAAKDNNGWRNRLKKRLFRYEGRKATEEEKAAAHLIRKLLDPDPIAREDHFQSEFLVEAVLEEPFFQGRGVDDAILQDIAEDAKSAARDAKSAATDAKAAAENTDKIIEVLKEHRYEMITMQGVLLKGIFEATEVKMPSAFIVLEEPIPSEEEEKEMESLKLKEDGSGFELGGDAAKHAKRAKKQFDLAEKWLGRILEIFEGVSDADSDKVFGSLKNTFKDLVTAKTLYFYLVDELTGKPVRDEGGIYPIKITTPSDIVPDLLPVLQVCMRAMSFYNGVAGITRLFGAPVPSVPASWRKGAQESVELLKQKSSVEKFGVVHDEVMSDSPENGKGDIRGESYRELQSFFEKYSKKDDKLYFAGLRRLGANDGTAVWTVLTDEQEVRGALKKREEERLAEEGAHEEYLNNLRDRAKHAAPHDLETAEANTGNIYIVIEIVKGKGFKAVKKTLGKSDVPDVYCKVKYGSSKWKTHHMQDDYSPEWLIEKVCKYDPNQEIEIDVFDKNRNGSDDYYGRASSAVSKILNANNSSLELEVKEQESPNGLTNRWSDGMFITIKCRKLKTLETE